MAKYYLTNKVTSDLLDIWDYTVKTWSKNRKTHRFLWEARWEWNKGYQNPARENGLGNRI